MLLLSVNVSVIFQLLLLAFVEKCLMKDEPYFYKEEWFDKVWILKKLKFKKDAQDLKASRPTEIECNCTNLNITQAETSPAECYRGWHGISSHKDHLLCHYFPPKLRWKHLSRLHHPWNSRHAYSVEFSHSKTCLVRLDNTSGVDLALEESKYIWRFGEALCKLVWPVETSFSNVSSLTLAVISLERLTTLSHLFARRLQIHYAFVPIMAYRSLRSNFLKLIKGSSANVRQRCGSKTS